MRFRNPNHEELVSSHIRELQALPGIRVTRRAALWLGTSGVMALLVGCGPAKPAENADDDDDDDDDDDGEDSTKEKSDDDDDGDPSHSDSSASEETSGGDPSDDTSHESSEEESTTTDDDASDPSSDDGESNSTTDETSDDTSSSDTTTDASPLTLQELMDLVHPDAQDLIAQSDPDEIAFLEHVVALMKRLEVQLTDHPTSRYQITSLMGDSPVEILQIDFAPGATIPLHDHADYIGALLGIKGTADCVNYTRSEGEVENGYFLLQETSRSVLEAGSTSYLGLELHNFHEVTAGNDGAQMIDLFVFFDPNGTSNWARLVEEVDADKKIYKAAWGNYHADREAHTLLGR